MGLSKEQKRLEKDRRYHSLLVEMTKKYQGAWHLVLLEDIERCREAVNHFEYYLGDREMKGFYALRSNLRLGLITKLKKP